MTERVLVVRREDHFGGSWPQGLTRFRDSEEALAMIEAFESTARFHDREQAEQDPSHKQLIPYCALRSGNEIFCVERLKAQGETRLHGRLSVGIGGHINPEDVSEPGSTVDGVPQGVVLKALERELTEEVEVPAEVRIGSARLLGMINDDSTSVGSVHVGLAFVLELQPQQARAIRIREISKMRGALRRLVGSDGLWQDPQPLESWSRLLVGEFAVSMADSGPRTLLEGDG